MHESLEGFPISERLVGLSVQIGLELLQGGGAIHGQHRGKPAQVDEKKRVTLQGSGRFESRKSYGIRHAQEKDASARQKRWGKRFRSVLAGIAKVRSLGDPLIKLLTFLCHQFRPIKV